jgi:alpha-tubulin suppressor-like RCC1 family protein
MGENHAIVLKTDGTLWGFGANAVGQLGRNATADNFSSPVQVGSDTDWYKISAATNGNHTVATKTNDTLWCWGLNAYGELGINSKTYKSSPTQIGALTTWSEVSTGSNFSASIKTDGTLWTWGMNASGRLGHNDVVYRSSPVQVGSLTDWFKISSASAHMMAIKTDKTLWTWGSGGSGKLGHDSTINISSPTQVGALTTWDKVSGGVASAAITKG